MKKTNWKKYTFEFLSIFIAVISAFALNNWNDMRSAKVSEEKILKEIKNGIDLDLDDFKGNVDNHKLSLIATDLFRDLINDKPINIGKDSIQRSYIMLFRDYTPIINLSGYESLKASGLKVVQNDSIRFKIIALYDYYYSIIHKLEDEIDEMKSFTNYYKPVNTILYPFMEFDEQGHLIQFRQPMRLSENQKKELKSYFWRLEINRKFKLGRYLLIDKKMKDLKKDIERYLVRK